MNRARLAGCIVVLMILQGCSVLSLGSKKTTTAVDIASQELSLIDGHLSLMRDITTGNYQQQLDLFADVESQREQDASARNRLRQALALITSGHPNSDRGRGYTELTSILESDSGLSEPEKNLARVVLNETENIMILEARNAELSATLSSSQIVLDQKGSTDRRSLSQARRDLELAQQEIESLEVELSDARAKLEAIKRIEVTSE